MLPKWYQKGTKMVPKISKIKKIILTKMLPKNVTQNR